MAGQGSILSFDGDALRLKEKVHLFPQQDDDFQVFPSPLFCLFFTGKEKVDMVALDGGADVVHLPPAVTGDVHLGAVGITGDVRGDNALFSLSAVGGYPDLLPLTLVGSVGVNGGHEEKAPFALPARGFLPGVVTGDEHLPDDPFFLGLVAPLAAPLGDQETGQHGQT